MDWNPKHFRAIIFYNFRCELVQQQCIDEFNSVFGDETLSRTSVYRWYGEFNRGRSPLQHEFRVVLETIDAVCTPYNEATQTVRQITQIIDVVGTKVSQQWSTIFFSFQIGFTCLLYNLLVRITT